MKHISLEEFKLQFDEMLGNISDKDLREQFEALGVEFKELKKVLVVKQRNITYETKTSI